ncbi:MAG: hypothetical protein IIB00_01670, partial [candidate division Zixibacteria bacterium]|nr:hypothetical protein [candidate division Zixibacteria bacterium]
MNLEINDIIFLNPKEGIFMKRVLTITAALVLIMAVAANASETRTTTMGDANNIVKDPGNIWLYPSTINMYPDQAEAVFNNFGNNDLHRVGVHYEFNASNPMVLGVYVVNNAQDSSFSKYFDPPMNSNVSLSSFSTQTNTNRSFNVFWGKNWNGNPFGVHFRLHNSSWEGSPDNLGINSKQSLTNFYANFGLTTSGGNVDWALAFWWTTWKDKSDSIFVPSLSNPDGNYGLNLRVRRWNSVSSKLTWVWHGQLMYEKQGETRVFDPNEPSPPPDPTTDISKCTHYLGDVGIGLNYTATSRALFILDFGLRYNSVKEEITPDTANPAVTQTKLRDLSIPYWRVGMDGEVFSWLDLRFGATNENKYITDEQITPSPAVENKDAGSNTHTFLGAGMHWGDNN